MFSCYDYPEVLEPWLKQSDGVFYGKHSNPQASLVLTSGGGRSKYSSAVINRSTICEMGYAGTVPGIAKLHWARLEQP